MEKRTMQCWFGERMQMQNNGEPFTMKEQKIRIGNYRYRILALVFMATSINYFDRSIVAVMAPILQKLFNWTNKDYAAIMVSFKIAYGIGLLFMGGVIDRLGTKSGYVISISIWSFFGMLHAAIKPAFSLPGFIIFLLQILFYPPLNSIETFIYCLVGFLISPPVNSILKLFLKIHFNLAFRVHCKTK